MKKLYIIIIIVISLLAVVFLVFPRIIHNNGDGVLGVQVSTVEIKGTMFTVDVVSTTAERNRGLSVRKKIATDEGMLFVFEKSGVYPFWMKGMKFPIDIIWINEELQVVYLKENALPESYPEVFTPNILAKYVLEVNAGIIKDKRIKIGDNVILNILDVQ